MIKLIVFLVIIIIAILMYSKSTFVGEILNQNYNSTGCTRENRSFPSGHIPGSYFGLTNAERENLLKRFIENNPNLI